MLEPGSTLGGRYELIRKLGSGGMGVVWEGKHMRLQQRVAIKVLQPEFAAVKEFQLRFEREARAAALLKSPHSVRVSDVDSTDGYTYIVMELLAGRDLGEETEKHGPLNPAEVVDWIIQACNALHEAHANKIIHRDIKPANIFIAQEEDRRVAKLLDFGISRYEDSVTAALTKPIDGALGTPSYMSPEQIRGRKLDHRTDIWSLGIVLYRVLGGRWPFAGASERAYLAAVISDPPLPFEHLRPDLSFELANVIMKALQKSPEDRPASARALAQMLLPFGTSGAVIDPSSPALARVSLRPPTEIPDTERDASGRQFRGGTARLATADTVATESPPDEAWGAAHTVADTPLAARQVPLGVDTSGYRRGKSIWLLVAALVLLGLGGAGWFARTKMKESRTGQDPPNPSVETSAPVAPTPTPSADRTVAGEPPPTGVPRDPTPPAASSGKKKPPSSPTHAPSAAPSAAVSAPPSLPEHL